MDVFKFVNSKDIREHLRNMDYSFSSIEAAWLIWQSKYTSLNEKHEAWRELIETMPDCEIEERLNAKARPSLHEFLKELMAFENRCIESLKKEEPYCVFSYKCKLPGEKDWENSFKGMCPDFYECLESASEACKAFTGSEDISNCLIRISKNWFDGTDWCIEAELTPDGEIIEILNYGGLTDEELDLISDEFDGMWFDFPNPFKKGDIIYNPKNGDESICLIEHEIPWKKGVEVWKKNGDYSDMLVDGIFQYENGSVYHECEFSYMDYEYYREPFTDKKRVLKAISNYLKGKITLDILLNAYHIILMEEQINDVRPWNITEKGLELAGINSQNKT